MINIYIGKDSLPKDKEFIFDVESFFGSSLLANDEFTNNVIKVIEKGEGVLRGNIFKDKYGGGLYSDCLSTGSKILLAAYYNPQYVINATELGNNGYCLISELTNGSLYFDNLNSDIEITNTPICLNGVICNNNGELFEQLTEVYYEM